ncbi:hypothetical protein M513_09062 [Trichuris suis]|uniref:Uncharacterized protein n=1 Tax=Trichuris suis TaxID=68888 RepID=A0A085LYQ6_9BILA|nr:hypothetical protein M513_09062 [Trichuris suis]
MNIQDFDDSRFLPFKIFTYASSIGEAHRYQEHMKALTRYRNAVDRLNIPTHYEDAPDFRAT